MGVKYETEPVAVDVKEEEEGDGRAKDEFAKNVGRSRMEREMRRGEGRRKKEEAKRAAKEEGSAEWGESLEEWRVKSECDYRERGGNSATSPQEGQTAWPEDTRCDAETEDMFGESGESEEKNGYHSCGQAKGG